MSLYVVDPALRLHCVTGTCYLHHPIKQKSYDLRALENQALKKLLSYIEQPKSEADVHAYMTTMLNAKQDKVVEYIAQLKNKGFIKQVNEKNSVSLWQQHNWHEAELLHENTVNTPRIFYNNKMGNAYDKALMNHYIKEKAPPANYKKYPGDKIMLQKPQVDESITIKNIFHRNKKPINLDKALLGRLLYFAFGRTGTRQMQVTGEHVRKTVPSGGARHPYEIYLLLLDVEGMSPGIYHYQFNDHYLSCLKKLSQQEIKKTIDKCLVIDPKRLQFLPQLGIVYSCVFERSMHRYRYPRSYRVMQYDLGHIYQNLEFLVKSYGLNIYSGYSCHEKQIEKEVGIDSLTESCMGYAVL